MTQVYLFFSLCHFGQQVVALLIHFVDEGVKFSAGFLQTHRQAVEKRPSPGVRLKVELDLGLGLGVGLGVGLRC